MRRALLALTGCRSDEIGSLDAEEWHALDALAAGHRLRPHLYGRLVRGEIRVDVPRGIAAGWRDAHRANALLNLAYRHALRHATRALEAQGIAAVALKGSALAWTVWPAPAERSMRDIDILVPEQQAAQAYDVLRAAGWEAPAVDAPILIALLEKEPHLPPLVSSDGVMLELHGHAWGASPLPGMAMPARDDGGFIKRSRRDDGLGMTIPQADDMLAHLVIHGALSHLFNAGPLVLADIDYLTAKSPIGWPSFWERAKAGGFAKAAALMIALTDRWRQPGLLARARCPVAIDEAAMAQAERLLCQDPEARKDINAIAGLRMSGSAGRLSQRPLEAAAMREGTLSGAARLGRRGLSLAGSLIDRETRRDGLETASLARWLGET